MSNLTKDEVDFLTDLVTSENLRLNSLDGVVDAKIITKLKARNEKVVVGLNSTPTEHQVKVLMSLVLSEVERMSSWHDRIEPRMFDRLKKRNSEVLNKLKSLPTLPST